MKERLITLAFALGALLLFAVMFLKREGGFGNNEVPVPISSERRGGGYQAAMAWLEGEGIRTLSLRERFNTLQTRDDLPKQGNLLIVTLPTRASFRTDEFSPLQQWLRAGNTLLVMAAISDNPDWAAFRGNYAAGDINLITGLEFETVEMREQRLAQRSRRQIASSSGTAGTRPPISAVNPSPESFRAFHEPLRTVLVPNRGHAYFDGVDELIALSDYRRAPWTVKVPYQGFVLALAHDRDNREGAIWTRPLGRGRVIVSGYGSLFTNRAIGLADNARLLANIVGANVAGATAGADPVSQAAVLFDDVHQGLGASYDPDKFYKDPRLYISLAILVALWFVWVLGATRLRLSTVRHSTPREAELIRAAGSFLSRALPNSAGARQLLAHFFRRVRVRAGAATDGPVPWDLLERNARIAQDDLQQIRRWHADAQSGRRVPLRDLHNLLVRLDRQMAT